MTLLGPNWSSGTALLQFGTGPRVEGLVGRASVLMGIPFRWRKASGLPVQEGQRRCRSRSRDEVAAPDIAVTEHAVASGARALLCWADPPIPYPRRIRLAPLNEGADQLTLWPY